MQTLEDQDTAVIPHQYTHTNSSSNGVDRLSMTGMEESGPHAGQGGTAPYYWLFSLFLFSCGTLTCCAGSLMRLSTYNVRHITHFQHIGERDYLASQEGGATNGLKEARPAGE
jgi:hypothetical protein